MFGRRKKQAGGPVVPPQDAPVDERDAPEDPVARERARLMQCWRRSEQRVLRTWHAWQAAGARDKPERYRAYLSALADEERAAATVQRAMRMPASPDHASDLVEPARP